MKRRKGLAIIAAVATILTVAGCSSSGTTTQSSGSDTANLTFWSWVPGIDKAVDLWNKENPKIRVKLEMTPTGSSGTYAKMYSALKAGKGAPDLAQVEYQELPGFILENGLVDLGPDRKSTRLNSSHQI